MYNTDITAVPNTLIIPVLNILHIASLNVRPCIFSEQPLNYILKDYLIVNVREQYIVHAYERVPPHPQQVVVAEVAPSDEPAGDEEGRSTTPKQEGPEGVLLLM